MFADFIEFETRTSRVSLNRQQVICAWLAEDWNNPVNDIAVPTPRGLGGGTGIGLLPPAAQAPIAARRTLIIAKTQCDRGEDLHFAFNTEEAAQAVYELIRDGVA